MVDEQFPWSTSPSRRNTGRLAVFVIKSDMVGGNDGLAAYSNLTRQYLADEGGIVEPGWPADLVALLERDAADSLWCIQDDRGRVHRLAMLRFEWGDVYWGLGSRQEHNVVVNPTPNAMSNLIINALRTRAASDGDVALYGYAVALEHSRFWRLESHGASVQQVMREWDIVAHTSDLHLDFRAPGASRRAADALVEAADEARRMKVKFSGHRNTSQAVGQSKWSRKSVTAVIAIHPETGAMTYDVDAGLAIREGVELRKLGREWNEIAQLVGHRIPSYRLRSEPDHQPQDAEEKRKRWCRAARNERRARLGLAELPLRLLPSGQPNPDYRPETILDQVNPGHALRSILLDGPKPATRDRYTVAKRVDADLGGLDPRRAHRELFTRGIYRRLVLDYELSNSEVRRFKWVSTDLGRFDDSGFLISDADFDVLEAGRRGTHATGQCLLAGIFEVDEAQADVWTDRGALARHDGGWRCGDDPGRLRFRIAGWETHTGYWFGFEPQGTSGRGKGSFRLAFASAKDFERSIVDAIIDGVDLFEPSTAQFLTVDVAGGVASRKNNEMNARRTLERTEAAYVAAVERTAEPEVSEERLAIYKDLARKRELERNAARAELEAAKSVDVPSSTYDLFHLADVLAVLQGEGPYPEEVVKRMRQLLGSFLRDGRVRYVSETDELRWCATLRLYGDSGHVLAVPVSGSVAGVGTSPWTGGLPWQWWTSCRSLVDLVGPGYRQKTKAVSRDLIAERLRFECDRWRGPNALDHFVLCPFPEVTAAGRNLALGEEHDVHPAVLVAVRDMFFAGDAGRGDLPGRRWVTWVRPNRHSEIVCDAVLLARGDKPASLASTVPGRTKLAVVMEAVAGLGEDEFTLKELAARVEGVSVMTVERALKGMRGDGLVVSRLDGRVNRWRLVAPSVE